MAVRGAPTERAAIDDSQSLKRAYDKGCDLADAAWYWGDAATKSALQSLKAPTAAKLPASASPTDSIMPLLEHMRQRSDIGVELQNRLFDLLKTHQLIAIGYALPRQPDDDLRIVPDDLLHARYKRLTGSALKGNGLHYAAVRVIPPDWLAISTMDSAERQNIAKSVVLPPKAKPGPKSKRDLIAEGYQELDTAGKLVGVDSLGKAVLLTQQYLQKRFPVETAGGKGISPETIRKTIKPKFDETRRTQNALSKHKLPPEN